MRLAERYDMSATFGQSGIVLPRLSANEDGLLMRKRCTVNTEMYIRGIRAPHRTPNQPCPICWCVLLRLDIVLESLVYCTLLPVITASCVLSPTRKTLYAPDDGNSPYQLNAHAETGFSADYRTHVLSSGVGFCGAGGALNRVDSLPQQLELCMLLVAGDHSLQSFPVSRTIFFGFLFELCLQNLCTYYH